MNKLILCVCGGGINTSANAKITIQDHIEGMGIYDIEVRHAMIGDIETLNGRKNMVVVWMTQKNEEYNAPGFQGITYLIGTRKKKEALTKEIMEKMDEIYVEL